MRMRYNRPKLKVADCIDCGAEFEVSRTKISPRCPDCRVDYNRLMSNHTYHVTQAYKAAMMQFSGPEDTIKNPGSEVEESVIQQMPGISYDEEWSILQREWELQELTDCMTDADRFSYGSGWQGVSPEDWEHIEDVTGSVLYDSQTGLRVSSPTVKSPRLPIGTNEGATTTDRELQGRLNQNAARARDDDWFTSHPFWNYETLAEIDQEQREEIRAIQRRTREAVAREARLEPFEPYYEEALTWN